MTDTITINSREGFASSLNTVGNLHAQLSALLGGSDKAIAAARTAASKGVDPSGAGRQVAPVYAASLDALQKALAGVDRQVSAAGASVQVALDDLGVLLQGLSSIDDAGAAEVNRR